MPRETHEQTINTALGEVLEELGQDWTVDSEMIGSTFEDGGRPDILMQKSEGWPIVIEAEVGNHRQAESDLRLRGGVVAFAKLDGGDGWLGILVFGVSCLVFGVSCFVFGVWSILPGASSESETPNTKHQTPTSSSGSARRIAGDSAPDG